MTDEELKRDLIKFSEYLEANGETTLCGMFSVENQETGRRISVWGGDVNWLSWSLASSVLAERGYEVKRK